MASGPGSWDGRLIVRSVVVVSKAQQSLVSDSSIQSLLAPLLFERGLSSSGRGVDVEPGEIPFPEFSITRDSLLVLHGPLTTP